MEDLFSEDAHSAVFSRKCDMCGACVSESYAHPLKDKIWLAANNNRSKGILCLDCIQLRLGRLLAQSDFANPESFMKLQHKGVL